MSVLLSGDLLRVLLVSPSTATRTELGDALSGAGELRYYWISQPDLALVRAQNLAPHVVVVDDELGDVKPGDLVRDLVTGVPDVVVIALVHPESLESARAMVLNGARAILTKPIQPDLLIGTLRQSLGRRATETPPPDPVASSGRTVVFCGSKGGTGRTTLAINTAVSLVDVARETVVIIDADYSAPAIDVALDLRHQRDITDLLPKLSALDADLMDNVLATHSSGVRVLLAPLPDANTAPPSVEQIEQIVSSLRRMYAWVLVDLGLPIDDTAYAFMDQADCIIMSVLPEMVGLRNARAMLRQFEARGYPRPMLWPTVNREGMGGSVPTAEVSNYLERPVRWSIPNDQELATETINRGVPMVISHRRRPLAQRYRALARELLDDRRNALVAAATEKAGTAAAEPPGAGWEEVPIEPHGAVKETVRLSAGGGYGYSKRAAVPAAALVTEAVYAGPVDSNSTDSKLAGLLQPSPEEVAGNGRNGQESTHQKARVKRGVGDVMVRVLAVIGGLGILGGAAFGILQLIQ